MSNNVQIPLLSNGCPIESTPDTFGPLRRSDEVANDPAALSQRMEEDGYVFLPGFFPRELVLDARVSVTNLLADAGLLDPDLPSLEAIANPGVEPSYWPELANGNPKIERLIYGPEILSFFEEFLGGDVRHFDYTWMRTVFPGVGACPHCDIVFMGRGTTRLYTAWTPLSDIPLQLGGLIVLEGSHQKHDLRDTYCQLDVDAMCSNEPEKNILVAKGYPQTGAISLDPHSLRETMGGRWLTTEYRMGDLLIFGMYTVHGSLDNQTKGIRLSTDSRYQLASEPVDERWVGEKTAGHGPEGKRSLIC